MISRMLIVLFLSLGFLFVLALIPIFAIAIWEHNKTTQSNLYTTGGFLVIVAFFWFVAAGITALIKDLANL